MTERKIAVYDNKYTFVLKPDDYRVHVLRHGEPWIVLEQGCNAVRSLVSEAIDMSALVAAVRRWASLGDGFLEHGELHQAFRAFCDERGEPKPPKLEPAAILRDRADAVEVVEHPNAKIAAEILRTVADAADENDNLAERLYEKWRTRDGRNRGPVWALVEQRHRVFWDDLAAEARADNGMRAEVEKLTQQRSALCEEIYRLQREHVTPAARRLIDATTALYDEARNIERGAEMSGIRDKLTAADVVRALRDAMWAWDASQAAPCPGKDCDDTDCDKHNSCRGCGTELPRDRKVCGALECGGGTLP